MSSRSAFGREKNNTMPSTSRTQQRAEAKYNVTTEFPRYDLHFAAASGNLGLVEFALSHGQPINSVLNGVLPLHAACAGGSEVVVKYLIDEGADVNAPRLPRRYSNDKHKSSGLAVGASGSTPLHFAAANGHMAVVRMLLARGAVPDRADKHGVTPEALARENGWVECAETLAAWSGGRAGDLPPLDEACGSVPAGSSWSANLEKERDGIGCDILDKRLQMKRSIDNALHLFKAPLQLHHHGSVGQLRTPAPPSPTSAGHPQSHSHSLFHTPHFHPSHLHLHHSHSHSASQLPTDTPALVGASANTNLSAPNTGAPPSPRPLGEYTFYPTTASPTSPIPSPLDSIPAFRRPSLPHIFGEEPASPFQRRLSGKKRRPRSAGTGAEQTGAENGVNGVNGDVSGGDGGEKIDGGINPSGSPYGYAGVSVSNTGTVTPRKLSSKISLRNLFRRANTSGEAGASASANGSGSEPGSGSASASTSYSASPAPIHFQAHAQYARSNSRGSVPAGSAAPSVTPPVSPLAGTFAASTPAENGSGSWAAGSGNGLARAPGTWHRARNASEGAVPRSPLVPSAVELHHRYSREFMQTPVFEGDGEGEGEDEDEDDAQMCSTYTQAQVSGSGSARPSILRGHNHSTSIQSSPGAASKALRFDATSSPGSAATTSGGYNVSMGVAGGRTSSATMLRGSRSASSLRHSESFGEEDSDYGADVNAPDSAPAGLAEFEDAEGVEDTEHAVISSSQTHLEYTAPVAGRARGASFASSISSSPGVSPDDNGMSPTYVCAEFPFSIDRPPLTPVSATSVSTATTHDAMLDDIPGTGLERVRALGDKDGVDARIRGASFSSVETDGSANADLSQSSSTSALTNITTPSPGTYPKSSSVLTVGGSLHTPLSDQNAVYVHDSPASSLEDLGVPADMPVKRAAAAAKHAPLDLRGISNLAEAEALVRRAQKEILVSAELPVDGPDSPGVPLSAQLAVYGEILALERRFARGEKQREQWAQRSDSEDEEKAAPRAPQSAKESKFAHAIAVQKKREASARQKATVGASPGIQTSRSARRPQGVAKSSKIRRPHTAEGAPTCEWSFVPSSAPSTEDVSAPVIKTNVVDQPHSKLIHSLHHSRSVSSPLYVNRDARRLSDIKIIETSATPIDSPKTPESTSRIPSVNDATSGASANGRPAFLPRSHTPDPEAVSSRDDGGGFTGGVPLVRVSTAPLQDTQSGRGSYASGSALRSDPATRRAGGAHKLARMGFSVDTHPHHHHCYSPSSSTSTSRSSPPKRAFGGIKSLVLSLKGKT